MTKAISQIANRKLGYGLTVFIFITIIFNYFEIYYHYWFLKLVNGYVIKIWLLPVLLFCFLLFKELLAKGYSFPLKAVSGVNLFIVFYVLFGFISLTVHEQPYYIGKYALIMFAPLTLYAVIVDSFRDNKNIEKVLNLLFIAGLILSLYVSYMFYILGPEKWSSENIEVKYMLTDVSAVRNLKESFNIQNFGYGNLAIRKTLIGIAEPTF